MAWHARSLVSEEQYTMINANQYFQFVFTVTITCFKSRAGKPVNRNFLKDDLPVIQFYDEAA